MNIRVLTMTEFNNFVAQHPLGNYYQSLNYAQLQAEQGYEYEFVGYCENTTILAATLILSKKIKNITYGYVPRGFLVDYTNFYFLKNFTGQIKEYYKKRGFAFIKINPEIAIGKLNTQTQNIEYNTNYHIIDYLIKCGYRKLKNNFDFEAILPRFNAVLPLENYNLNMVSKNTRNKIKKGISKGLTLEMADKFGINIFYKLIEDKVPKDNFYYIDKFNVFNQNDAIDLFLVSVDYNKYLLNAEQKYEHELEVNNYLNEKIAKKSYPNLINRKMNSDQRILTYKNEIVEATQKVKEHDKYFIAGALVIKYGNRIKIDVSGFDPEFKNYAPNYFLYHAILEYYKNNYKYAELNGVSGNFNKDNPYYGLTRFKMGYKADIYEYIGEFDLVIDPIKYEFLLKSGRMAKEFAKD